VAVWAAHEARGGGQPFWEESRVFIYAGGDSPGDPRSLSESGPHGSRRDPVRGPRLE
jgi:hypothetical protein